MESNERVAVVAGGQTCYGLSFRPVPEANDDGSVTAELMVWDHEQGVARAWSGPVYPTREEAETAAEEHDRPTFAYVSPGNRLVEPGTADAETPAAAETGAGAPAPAADGGQP